MGTGASISKQTVNIFTNQELLCGNQQVRQDENLRKSFAKFIKDGTWESHVVRSPLVKTKCYTREERVARENNSRQCLYEYRIAKGNIQLLDSYFPGENDKGHSPSQQSLTEHDILVQQAAVENYVNIVNVCGFKEAERLSVLFCALYPLYRQQQCFKHEAGHSEVCDDYSSSDDVVGNVARNGMVKFTPHSVRAQELLLACAASYDESMLLDVLSESEAEDAGWADTVAAVLERSVLGITVMDATHATATANPAPIVYANNAFLSMSGYSLKEVLGKGLDFFHGPETDAALAQELAAAVREEDCAKFAIKQYSKSSRCSLHLIAMHCAVGDAAMSTTAAAVAAAAATAAAAQGVAHGANATSPTAASNTTSSRSRYVVAVHFRPKKHSKLTDLKVVIRILIVNFFFVLIVCLFDLYCVLIVVILLCAGGG